ncbi:HEAT repeat domain-containing protein [Candidatus Poribacteria bacterium]|jgi:hypothetical protein|nr:HEAT repeat domain-containing protein [Candidatus Poribacteria bacterium]MBT5534540.1 HEAT repeat domain-containing protein [Candidatus Poribacteria bacterium]MBT5711609.1 HEAT repeat domain-containing protein [Candidatus Poribacteria bacterium]MBT7097207.1 HEAT repeat domain-containing protein [Candidatus Poribacteria bacterium]MBT7805696.1 HEAT repeat domain-containing protein [Candidatus Poribacteria bacterium]
MPQLLDDQAMWDFIADGYTVVHADFPSEFHAQIHRDTEAVFAERGNVGNGILAAVPELAEVFEHSAVSGALTSVLGPGYRAYPHRHCHLNAPQSAAQAMHLDSYEADENNRHHRARWAMAFYYPHDIDDSMGPTSVVPRAQYHSTRPSNDEACFTGAAGSVCIVHYDSWHRATANLSDVPRYMHKWLFIRTAEPAEPSWDHSESSDPDCPATADLDSHDHRGMWASLWNWHCGGVDEGHGDGAEVADLCVALSDDAETVRLNAAYALGRVGERAVAPLVDALRDEADRRLDGNLAASMTNPSHLYAGYALSAVGAPAVPALTDALESDSWAVRAAAANTLGDIGRSAADAVPALAQRLDDEEPWVRRNAAEALGHLGVEHGVGALGQLLTDEVEWVRLNAAVALTRIGPRAVAALPQLVAALGDEAYYVRANAAHALDAIGAQPAHDALTAYLAACSDY